ncbi:peroxiredoxin family protein [Phenylobacterium sp.]|uniref:peroxiredoxin family protein n=1 Tax=Phenylobacterium sp. TaxID=1871053 RepID=UPI002E32DF3D|nr:peroxiredoxin family protein [Phenylobacterium sp.]HEX3366775.1 peroxiredoxin family protein [Phenylobacterium sp.]
MKLAAVLSLAVSLLLPLAASAAAWDVGPPLGAKVPALHATDLKGAPVNVRGLSGKNGLVLVFFRSAKWCPYCQKQLMDMKDAPGPLGARGYKLAAISYDPTDVLTQFTEKREIPYPLLSDPGSVTIDAWKLRDIRYKPDTFAWGVPYASIYVISPQGVLKAKLAEEDYKVRPPLSAILETIDGLPKGR